MNIDAYQQDATATDKSNPGIAGVSFLLLGLFGEVGTLVSALKKHRRDEQLIVEFPKEVLEEFGDVLWYFSNLATHANKQLSELLADGIAGNTDAATFDDLEYDQVESESVESAEFEEALFKLSGKAGAIMAAFPRSVLDTDIPDLCSHLKDFFHSLVNARRAAAVSLNDAARSNLDKANSRFAPEDRRAYSQFFDRDRPEHEQLPRRLEIEIFEANRQDAKYVVQRCKGINIGHRLSDERPLADDYRFHDVFHLGYWAVLGWSPTMRDLFKLNRSGDDRRQDTYRARHIEEGMPNGPPS